MSNQKSVLNAERVNTIWKDCLFMSGTGKRVRVEGIIQTVDFGSESLKKHKAEIEAMLAELSPEFHESGGGGMSFLNSCHDQHGNQWTGLHQRMDQLFQLGMGINKARPLFPRDMWPSLPGGMPYFIISS